MRVGWKNDKLVPLVGLQSILNILIYSSVQREIYVAFAKIVVHLKMF